MRKTKKTRKTPKINRKTIKKRKVNVRGFKKEKCAPNPKSNSDFTCYTDDALKKMKELWNVRHPDCKIKSEKSDKIWEELRDLMGETCNRESCWLRQKFIENNLDKDLLNYTFAPKKPKEWDKDPNTWLNSRDILSVMKQYEKYYTCFDFIGPSPINYDTHIYDGECVWKELCEFSLKEQIQKGKTKIGIIFNLDPHYLSGSHWFACFIHIPKRKLYYFDSYGEPAHKQVHKLFNMIKKQGKELNMEFTEIHNRLRHQYSDSECGMYSLYFIVEMLKDKNPEYFLKHRIDDKLVMALRKKYFN
jgi:hypothetical protein